MDGQTSCRVGQIEIWVDDGRHFDGSGMSTRGKDWEHIFTWEAHIFTFVDT